MEGKGMTKHRHLEHIVPEMNRMLPWLGTIGLGFALFVLPRFVSAVDCVTHQQLFEAAKGVENAAEAAARAHENAAAGIRNETEQYLQGIYDGIWGRFREADTKLRTFDEQGARNSGATDDDIRKFREEWFGKRNQAQAELNNWPTRSNEIRSGRNREADREEKRARDVRDEGERISQGILNTSPDQGDDCNTSPSAFDLAAAFVASIGGAALTPWKELVKANSAVLDAAGDVVIKIGEAVPGQGVKGTVEFLVGAERTMRKVGQSPEQGVVEAIESGELGSMYAAPLAEALAAAHDRYERSAKSVPAEVRQALGSEFNTELARARYVVSKFEINLPAAINHFQGTSHRAGLHAVTVDDIIVFSSVPSSSDTWLWAHELHHVRQYKERGSISSFARWYLSECEAVERAADDRANKALGMNLHPSHCL
jgi:hypothetical protein